MNPFRQLAVSKRLPSIDGYDPVLSPPARRPAIRGLCERFEVANLQTNRFVLRVRCDRRGAQRDAGLAGGTRQDRSTRDRRGTGGVRRRGPGTAGGRAEQTARAESPCAQAARLQFFLTNTYPHAVIEHVKVLYYVVRVDKLGRKAAPSFSEPTEPDKNAAGVGNGGDEGAVRRGFQAGLPRGARLKFQITEPGLYSALKRSALRAITNISRPSTWWPNEYADCAQAGHPPTRASFCSSGNLLLNDLKLPWLCPLWSKRYSRWSPLYLRRVAPRTTAC